MRRSCISDLPLGFVNKKSRVLQLFAIYMGLQIASLQPYGGPLIHILRKIDIQDTLESGKARVTGNGRLRGIDVFKLPVLKAFVRPLCKFPWISE